MLLLGAISSTRNLILVFTILKKPTIYENCDFSEFFIVLFIMWHCVEERQDNIENYGRIRRKIIFGEIFKSRENLLQGKQNGRIGSLKVNFQV